MKKINYYLGALALASLSLGACSSDKLNGEEPNGPDSDVERTLYVNVAINGEGLGSRAASADGNPAEGTGNDLGDFDNGTPDEQKVNTCYLVFYDVSGQVVGNIVNVTGNWSTETTANGTISNQLKKTVTLSLQQGQDNPAKVMCYINPANPADLQNPLSTVQTITRDAVTVPGTNGTSLFPMSSSVYYGADGNVVMGSDVAGKYYTTLEAAEEDLEKAAPEKVVDIYVERYAAKLTMNTIGTVNDYVTYTDTDADVKPGSAITENNGKVVMKFTVKGWDVNGVAKNTYAVKSFRQAATGGQIMTANYTYELLNKRINAQTFSYVNGEVKTEGIMENPWTWNNASDHRSYWACSPVYFQAEYPVVASDYVDANSNQVFKSWNQIVNSNKAYNTPYYFMETTSGIPALRSKNPNAAVPTLCLVGEYTLTLDGQKLTKDGTPVTTTPDFYTYLNNGINQHPTVYFRDKADNNNKTAESEVDGTVSMHKRFLWQTTVLYKNTAAEGENPKYERLSVEDATYFPTMVAATTVTRPSDAVLGEGVKLASYAQTLQFTSAQAAADLYINVNGTPKAIVADDATNYNEASQVKLTEANKILMQNVGYCHVYTGGAGKFSVPVKHLGWYRGGNEQKDSEKIDMAKVHVGDLGLVRNHSYTVSISEISGLATGVAGKDTPIIPPADTKDVYMAYRINVLRWAVVPTQGVKL